MNPTKCQRNSASSQRWGTQLLRSLAADLSWLLWIVALLATPAAPSVWGCPTCQQPAIETYCATATKTSTAAGGNWSSASTWDGGSVPVAGDTVLIRSGATVVYDVTLSPALHWIRVEGTLDWSVGKSTELQVDTLYIAPAGTMRIGASKNSRLPPSYTATVTFLRHQPSVRLKDRANDSTMLTRGLVCLGACRIFGAYRADAYAIASQITSTTTSATLVGTGTLPTSWKAGSGTLGDEVVITGTSWNVNEPTKNFSSNSLIRLTGIDTNAKTISWSGSLPGSHALPQQSPDEPLMRIHAANLTRNVVFRTDPALASAADSYLTSDAAGDVRRIQERAHAMFTDAAKTEIYHAAFVDMGRTDKARFVTDPGTTTPTTLIDSKDNVRGRYPVHLHKPRATAAPNNDITTEPVAVFIGLVVRNSPGWGIVIHAGNALIRDCVTYNVLGAHFVTEDGSERVDMQDNIAILGIGAATKNDYGSTRSPVPVRPSLQAPGVESLPQLDLTTFGTNTDGNDPQYANLVNFDPNVKASLKDFGSEGIGYWLHSTYVVKNFSNNVACGMYDNGVFVWGHNDDSLSDMDVGTQYLIDAGRTDITGLRTTMKSFDVPMETFNNTAIYNCGSAIHFQGHLRDDTGRQDNRAGGTAAGKLGHLVPSKIENTTAFALRGAGIDIDYSSHLDLVGVTAYSTSGGTGSPVVRNTTDMTNPQGAAIWQQKNARHVSVTEPVLKGWDRALGIGQTDDQSLTDRNEIDLGYTTLVLGAGSILQNNLWNFYPALGRQTNQPDPNGTKVLHFPPFGNYTRLSLPLTGVTLGNNLGQNGNSSPPTAEMATPLNIGGLAYRFDASASSDPDYAPAIIADNPATLNTDESQPTLGNNDIVAFQWSISQSPSPLVTRYGRRISHVFPNTGPATVQLTVMDSSGLTGTTTLNLTPVNNPVAVDYVTNGTFASRPAGTAGTLKVDWLTRANESRGGTTVTEVISGNWIIQGDSSANPVNSRWAWNSTNQNLEVTPATNSKPGRAVYQVIWNDHVLRTNGTLSYTLNVPSGAPQVSVAVWGTNEDYFNIDVSKLVTPTAMLDGAPATLTTLVTPASSATGNVSVAVPNIPATGFKFLVIGFGVPATSVTSGAITLDNVSLTRQP